MANRLAGSPSPYLLQHADNPVDWWEWGRRGVRRGAPARRAGAAVGRATPRATGATSWPTSRSRTTRSPPRSTTGFVAVKVDREERPDVDAVYMAATTALTGHGGWPMTCLLTPDGDPFFAGTYLPRPQLLALLDQAPARCGAPTARPGAGVGRRTSRRSCATQTAPTGADAARRRRLRRRRARACARRYDDARGGFGGAPKFPPSMVLEFLLRHHARTGSADALAMARGTCEAMARGGMYDQLGGGFARYSVDAGWVVPHFEKMLYDNALLLRVYAHLWRATGDPLARRVAEETADFLLRDLRTAEGAFASALDADTVVDGHSHEGLTYAWTPAQLVEVLGADDGGGPRRPAVRHRPRAPSRPGRRRCSCGPTPTTRRGGPRRATRLLAARATAAAARPRRQGGHGVERPGGRRARRRRAAARPDRPRRRRRARAADVRARPPPRRRALRRTSRGGVVGAAPGVLDDHGDLAEGLLALHQATGEPGGPHAGRGRCSTRRSSGSSTPTASCTTPPTTPPPSSRGRAGRTDNAEPAGASALAGALLTLRRAHRVGAPPRRGVGGARRLRARSPSRSHGSPAGRWRWPRRSRPGRSRWRWSATAPTRRALAEVARAARRRGWSWCTGCRMPRACRCSPTDPSSRRAPAAYVCRGFVCERPVTHRRRCAAPCVLTGVRRGARGRSAARSTA